MDIKSDLKQAYDDVISVFYDIAQDLTSSFDEKEIIDLSLNVLKKVIDYDAISFLTYIPSRDMYIVQKSIDYNQLLKKNLLKLVKDGIITWAANLGRPFVNVEDIGEIKTTVIVPLLYKEVLQGAIIIHTKKDENYFEQNRLKILTIVSNQLTISFENLNLYKNVEKRNNKLKAMKSYLDNVITSMTNGIIVLDNKNIIRVFNKKTEELLGISHKEVINKNIDSTEIKSDFIREISNIQSKISKGNEIIDQEFEYEITKDDKMPFGISATILKKENEYLGGLFVLRDMRETKELMELKRIDKLKDEFLSMVSHELRTPLTSIKAYAETLLDMVEENDVESEREFLNIINEESERLSRLINDVLDLSKIEAGKMSFLIQEEEIDILVNKSIKNIYGFANEKKISLIPNIIDKNIIVLIDSDRILQVLANLLNNAIKFTCEEGKVEIIVKKSIDNFVEINIKDNGVGIKEDEIENVFEKFKQSEDILVRESGGTGLGLPICRNIVEYHGGKLWVESKYGEGSEFKFTIPIKI
ncbi:MAG: PAS domain S-box protein [Fusobacteria bacterium]|nr:PAS domain S-box protein [Fusobacteriota bacterium]